MSRRNPRQSLTVSVHTHAVERVKAEADRRDTSVSVIVREALKIAGYYGNTPELAPVVHMPMPRRGVAK